MQTTLEQLQNLKQQIDDLPSLFNYDIPDKPGKRIKFTEYGGNDFEGILLRRFKERIVVCVDRENNKEYYGENPRSFHKQEIHCYGNYLKETTFYELYKELWDIVKVIPKQERFQLLVDVDMFGYYYKYALLIAEYDSK
jgi:hypothetical protein